MMPSFLTFVFLAVMWDASGTTNISISRTASTMEACQEIQAYFVRDVTLARAHSQTTEHISYYILPCHAVTNTSESKHV